MQSIAKARHLLGSLLVFLCAVMVQLIILSPGIVSRGADYTTFLPFKINAPDVPNLVAIADTALASEVAAKGLTLVPRAEAQRLVAYDGPWPPPAAASPHSRRHRR